MGRLDCQRANHAPARCALALALLAAAAPTQRAHAQQAPFAPPDDPDAQALDDLVLASPLLAQATTPPTPSTQGASSATAEPETTGDQPPT